MPRQMRSISAGSRPVSLRPPARACTSPPAGREQLVHVAERQPAVLAGPLDLLERVALLAQARDDPRVGRGGAGPAAAVVAGSRPARPSAAAWPARRPPGARPRRGSARRPIPARPAKLLEALGRACRCRRAVRARDLHVVQRGVRLRRAAGSCARRVDLAAERAAQHGGDRDRRRRARPARRRTGRQALPRPSVWTAVARVLARDVDLVRLRAGAARRGRRARRRMLIAVESRARRLGVDQHAGVQDRRPGRAPPSRPRSACGEAVRALAVVPGPVVAADRVVVGDRAAGRDHRLGRRPP